MSMVIDSHDSHKVVGHPASKHHRPTEPLTKPEREILLGLETAIKRHGNPSLQEIAECAGTNHYASTAHKYLRQLERKGYVRLPQKKGRMRGVLMLFPAPPQEKPKKEKSK